MVRPAKESDLAGILEIYNDAILNTTAVFQYQARTLEDRLEWFKEKMADGYPVLVYEDNGRIAGYATFGPFRPSSAYKYTVENSVHVHRDYRGRGIGRRLMEELIRLANEKGYATMIAGVEATNAASIALHEKLGFRLAGTVKKAGFKFGKWLDLAFYQRELDGPAAPEEG